LFGLTINDIERGVSKLRNRVIGQVFNKLGLIEQWGSGILRMFKVCEDAGFPRPQFEEIGTHFRATFYLKKQREPALDKKNKLILDILRDSSNGCTTSIIASHINLSTRATRTRLIKLKELGLIIEISKGPYDPNRKYFLSGKK